MGVFFGTKVASGHRSGTRASRLQKRGTASPCGRNDVMKTRFVALGLVLALGMGVNAFASGMLIPKDESLPALAVKSQRVDIRIKDGVAGTKVEQVFKNSIDRDLEAVFVFPLPPGAAISDFAMWIGGKRVSGELVEKKKAREVYEGIVRRMRDPGLLEYMSGNLLRVSVFPVPKNGEQKIEIEYSQQLDFDAGLYKFTYPLKTGEKASRTLEDFTVSVRVNSAVPIKTIYSPTHKVGITRKGDNEAVLGFEEDKSLLDRDFEFYYGVSKQAFGLNLLTHAPDGKDGYFMVMLAPPVEPPKGEAIKRDMVFVFDTSGSMSGDKIRQARDALKYCVGRLQASDTFSVIRFSTDVEVWRDESVAATEANRAGAIKFIEGFEARGGTDINSALASALALKSEDGRMRVVVFLTDGRPTIGTTVPADILDAVRKARKSDTRIFVFGVGHDVNTHLLDKIGGDHGGISQYVEPKEDIEVKVSGFYDKVSCPVLAKPVVKIEGVTVKDMHPGELTDLFAGGQITIFGRYKDGGKSTVVLSGDVNGRKQAFEFNCEFAAKNPENSFIPRLWATRRVGYLLDQIRLHGEEKELKDEVIRLSKEYAIMTPYTSYLVLEGEADYKTHGIDRRQFSGEPRSMGKGGGAGPTSRGGGGVPGLTSEGGGGEAPATRALAPAEGAWADKASAGRFKADEAAEVTRLREVLRADPKSPDAERAHRRLESMGRRTGGAEAQDGGVALVPVFDASDVPGRPEAQARELKEQVGARAVTSSRAIDAYKTKDVVETSVAPAVKYVGKKVFYLVDGVWTDRDYKKGMKERKVKYGSEEYFKLFDEHPDWKQYFALGEKIILCADAQTAVIVE
jgi:Ca-activated chloride channel family protein